MKALERLLAYRPSASMIVALIALFVAMGGTTYAVKRLPSKSVGTAQLKRNAVRTANIKARNVTRSRIAKGAVDSSLVATNSLTGGDIRESSLGTVRTATSAATAGDAATVGGRTVQKFFFSAPAGTPATLVLNLDGLGLTATCDAGPALSVTASTAVSGAFIHTGGTHSVAAPFYDESDPFDIGDSFDVLDSGATGGTNLRGTFVYARTDGTVLTADFFAEETATRCMFAGTAIG